MRDSGPQLPPMGHLIASESRQYISAIGPVCFPFSLVDPPTHTTSYLVFPTRAPLLDGPNSRHTRTPWDTRVGAWVGSLGDSVATVSGASGFWKSTSPPFRTRSWILHEPLMFLWLLAASLSKIWCSGSQLPPAGQNGLRPVRLQPLAHDTPT